MVVISMQSVLDLRVNNHEEKESDIRAWKVLAILKRAN